MNKQRFLPSYFYACLFPLFILGIIMAASSGCSHVEKVRVLEGDIDTPYQILGTLEVKTKTPVFRVSNLVDGTKEALTLGYARTPVDAEKIKKDLDNKLMHDARDHYGADAVVKVRYWPNLASGSFPDGYAYARGEMVRYEPFPNDAKEKDKTLQTTISHSDQPA